MTHSNEVLYPAKKTVSTSFRVASFNLAFDRSTYEDLLAEMSLNEDMQNLLIAEYVKNSCALAEDEKRRAKHIIQIRHIAAIIQIVRPDILFINEFNNDGDANCDLALAGFLNHYLANPQNSRGVYGGKKLTSIQYPYFQNISTNTGLNSPIPLNQTADVSDVPEAKFGFGHYHGQYAFALLSKFPIDWQQSRTFQTFLWKDMPDKHPPQSEIRLNRKKKEDCLCPQAWDVFRLSSKNHVDCLVQLNQKQPIHLLLSHPTPPIFTQDNPINFYRNRDEIRFWQDYIQGAEYIYDDCGKYGGITKGEPFIVLGDLNSDPLAGDSCRQAIQSLIKAPGIHPQACSRKFTPASRGGGAFKSKRFPKHAEPQTRTSLFGLRVDYVLPSYHFKLNRSGVFWPDRRSQFHPLFQWRTSKGDQWFEFPSDHRMVWMDVDLSRA